MHGPFRVMAVGTFVNTLGNGLFITVGALYLTRKVGISAAHLGIGLSIAAAVGLVAGVQFGQLADRRGHREILVGLTIAEGLAIAAYAFVGGFWPFLVVACLEALFDRGSSAARNALVASAFPVGERVRTRARLRAITNVGIGLGALGGGLVLHVDTKVAYQTVLLFDGLTSVLTGLILLALPHVPGRPAVAGAAKLPALRDRPFLVVTALNAVLSLQFGLIEIAVPLWIANRTNAPRIFVAGALLLNTILCVLFQVRASRGTDTLVRAGHAQARAGVLLGIACVLFAVAYHRDPAVAAVLVLAAAAIETVGELLSSAGGWGLSYGLAPPELQGSYQGVYNAGFGVAMMIGPGICTLLCVTWGVAGWLVLGAIFVAAGLAVPLVVPWAERTRAAAPESASATVGSSG